jgi:hypothetical protein
MKSTHVALVLSLLCNPLWALAQISPQPPENRSEWILLESAALIIDAPSATTVELGAFGITSNSRQVRLTSYTKEGAAGAVTHFQLTADNGSGGSPHPVRRLVNALFRVKESASGYCGALIYTAEQIRPASGLPLGTLKVIDLRPDICHAGVWEVSGLEHFFHSDRSFGYRQFTGRGHPEHDSDESDSR